MHRDQLSQLLSWDQDNTCHMPLTKSATNKIGVSCWLVLWVRTPYPPSCQASTYLWPCSTNVDDGFTCGLLAFMLTSLQICRRT